MRRGHGGAREGFVAATGDARDDVDAGGGDIGIDLAERARAATREVRDQVVDILNTETLRETFGEERFACAQITIEENVRRRRERLCESSKAQSKCKSL